MPERSDSDLRRLRCRVLPAAGEVGSAYGSTTQRGRFTSSSMQFRSLDEAVAEATKQLRGLRWL